MKREPTRVMTLLLDKPWAITRNALSQMLYYVDRRLEEALDSEAVSRHVGRALQNTGGQVEVRDKVAVLDVTGPIFRYADVFHEVSGATSVQKIATQLQTILDAQGIEHIVLNVDSPGGQADGINEMADIIRAANAQKPITAYVGGLGASAAYWLASAASNIVINESAFVGSIGVVVGYEDRNGAAERQGVKRYEFVNSKSPRKRPDPSTEAGREQLQEMADNAAELFINKVATFRGVSSDDVVTRFGAGGLLMGAAAVKAGMVDALGSFEGLISQLNSSHQEVFSMAANEPGSPANPNQPTTVVVTNAPVTQADIDAGTRVAADRERARIQSILSLEEAKGNATLAQELALTPGIDAETAKRILAAAPKAAPTNPLAAAMSNVPNPVVGVGEGDSDADEAARVLSFVPKERRVTRTN
jgi:signal peptide peptidase SppA